MITDESIPAIHALTIEQLAEILRQAETGYPEEICGIVIGKPGSPDTYRVCQVTNVANKERQQDTRGIERDARTAYRMDDREVLSILRRADESGDSVITFYHSHPDHDAYFSAMDRDRALRANHEPLWPGATYLIVSVRHGRAAAARYFTWNAAQRDFSPVAAPLPSRG